MEASLATVHRSVPGQRGGAAAIVPCRPFSWDKSSTPARAGSNSCRGELAEFPVTAWGGGEQGLGVVIARRAEHLLGRAVLDHAALAHHGDVVADLRRHAQV